MHIRNQHQKSRHALIGGPSDAELGRLLQAVDRITPGIGQRDHFGLRTLRLQQVRGEVGGAERMTDSAQHRASRRCDEAGGVALQRMAEGVVGGEEEPGVGVLLQERFRDRGGFRIGVVGKVEAVGRALLAGKIGLPGPEIRKMRFLSRVMP